MRLPAGLITGFTLACSALVVPPRAPAQVVKRDALVGIWRGHVAYTDSTYPRKGISWLTLWSDGLWWFNDETMDLTMPGFPKNDSLFWRATSFP